MGSTSPARPFTEPLREMCAWAMLVGNAVFQLLSIIGLLVVIDRWGTDFGLRSAREFPRFVGLLALGFPLAAMLIATHVAPAVARARAVMVTVLAELGVSALFGVVTFLGAFAYDLASPRATIEGLLYRGVWLGLLVVVGVVAIRVWMGLYPPPSRRLTYTGIPGVYGKPYPGQPAYSPMPASPMPASYASPHQVPSQQMGPAMSAPATGFAPGAVAPGAPTETLADAVTDAGQGWPVVPPPPMPAPPHIEPDLTIRVPIPTQDMLIPGDATQVVAAENSGRPESGSGGVPHSGPGGIVEPNTRDMSA